MAIAGHHRDLVLITQPCCQAFRSNNPAEAAAQNQYFGHGYRSFSCAPVGLSLAALWLEVRGPDIGNQIEERDMFLAGVTAELAAAGDRIQIMVGGKPTGHVTHVITAPILVNSSNQILASTPRCKSNLPTEQPRSYA